MNLAELNRKMLAARRAKKQRQRQREIARAEMAGRVPSYTEAECHERNAVAIFAHDCWLDIWAMLENHGMTLEVTWVGKTGQLSAVYTDGRPGGDVLMVSRWDPRRGHIMDLPGIPATDIGRRIGMLLDQHRCELGLFWVRRELWFVIGSRAVPHATAALTLVKIAKGETGRPQRPQADVEASP